jgi:hypothetical protein
MELSKEELQRLIEYWFTLLEIQEYHPHFLSVVDMDKTINRELYRKLVNMQGEEPE